MGWGHLVALAGRGTTAPHRVGEIGKAGHVRRQSEEVDDRADMGGRAAIEKMRAVGGQDIASVRLHQEARDDEVVAEDAQRPRIGAGGRRQGRRRGGAGGDGREDVERHRRLERRAPLVGIDAVEDQPRRRSGLARLAGAIGRVDHCRSRYFDRGLAGPAGPRQHSAYAGFREARTHPAGLANGAPIQSRLRP